MNSRLLYALPALVLALVAVILALVGFLRTPPSPGSSVAVAPAEQEAALPPDYDYLVAIAPLSPGDVLEEDGFQVISSSTPIAEAVPAGEVRYGSAISSVIQVGDLLRNEQLEAGSLVRSLLKPGTQAIAIPVNDVSGVGGLLQPGDEVNVYASFSKSDKNEPAALTVLKNVVVIAVRGVAYSGDAVSDEERRRNASVVLAVPNDKVSALLLASNEGDVRLAALAEPEPQLAATGTAGLPDPTYLKDLFPSPPPPPRQAAPRRPAGSRVQVFEGTEQRSVYVR